MSEEVKEVWLVEYGCYYEGKKVEGVFGTKNGAIAYCERFIAEWTDEDSPWKQMEPLVWVTDPRNLILRAYKMKVQA